MSGHPDAAALVRAVESFLRGLEASLDSRQRFHARVAGNTLAMVARELEQRPDIEEAAALGALLGCQRPVDELRAAVCAGLRDGSLTAATPGLIDALSAAAAVRLAVDNPNYTTLARFRGETA